MTARSEMLQLYFSLTLVCWWGAIPAHYHADSILQYLARALSSVALQLILEFLTITTIS